MKLLLDTNILIPLEPSSPADLVPHTKLAADLLRKAQQAGVGVFVHPIQETDIRQDKDANRRGLRLALIRKYPSLPSPPAPSSKVLAECGNPPQGTNSWIDAHLIAALQGDLVDILVTEDREMHRACRDLNLDSRCHTLAAALEVVEDELPIVPSPPPAVRGCLAHELTDSDPIFDGLRADYERFDTWLAKCRREHRQCWVVKLQGRATYAGVCIVNPEDRRWADAPDPTLKICTFKIADNVAGMKLGELLLRAVLEYAHANGFGTLFLEVFPKHGGLLRMLRCFGFEQHEHTKPGSEELVLRKVSVPPSGAPAPDRAEYHRLYGPYRVRLEGCRVFVVPIEPRYHCLLFPHLENQIPLFPGGESCGNAIRKVYLCNSSTRKLRPGDLLLFYRSRAQQGITALGVVEETLRTRDPEKLTRFATRRTVYERPDIEGMTAGREALGILFREAPILNGPVQIEESTKAGLLTRIPQSITQLKPAVQRWMQTHLK